MKILLDNEQQEFHRMVSIQDDAEQIDDVLDVIIDGLKAYGFSEEIIYDAILKIASEIE